jgi:hypothetical protein
MEGLGEAAHCGSEDATTRKGRILCSTRTTTGEASAILLLRFQTRDIGIMFAGAPRSLPPPPLPAARPFLQGQRATLTVTVARATVHPIRRVSFFILCCPQSSAA